MPEEPRLPSSQQVASYRLCVNAGSPRAREKTLPGRSELVREAVCLKNRVNPLANKLPPTGYA
ncbi:hypothetical protein QCD79_23705 [Pseudomonas quasicaspiana]|nr:hypothetical protein [Pseudomonas syringae]MDG6403025.1 hypothetical protein [Pseudomonas quasicaspiana]